MSCAGHALHNDLNEGMDDMPPLDSDSEDEYTCWLPHEYTCWLPQPNIRAGYGASEGP